MKKESMVFPFRWMRSLSMLSDAEFRAMVTAIIDYAESGVPPSFSGAMACAWQEYKQRIDNDRERYEQICEKRRSAGMKGAEFGVLGGRPKKHHDSDVTETPNNPKRGLENPKKPQKTPDPDPDPELKKVSASADTKESPTAHTPSYPTSVDGVLKIAHLPQCGVPMTRESAERYFITRMASDWVDANNRKISVGQLVWDIKKWFLNDKQKPPAASSKDQWRGRTSEMEEKDINGDFLK